MRNKKARNLKMIEQNNDMENMIREYGLEKLDESDQIAVFRMYKNLKDYKKNEKILYGLDGAYYAACYTQNYLLLKQLLNLQEQNNQIIEQNNKVIELLTEIKNK